MNKRIKEITILVLVVVSVILGVSYIKQGTEKTFYTDLSLKEVNRKIKNRDDFVLYFYSNSCSKCIYLKENLKKDDFQKEILALNLDNIDTKSTVEDLLIKYKIMRTPTFLIFKNGNNTKRLDTIDKTGDVINFVREGMR